MKNLPLHHLLFSYWFPSPHPTSLLCLSSFSQHFPSGLVPFASAHLSSSLSFLCSHHPFNQLFISSSPTSLASTLPELQFLVEHHLCRQQQGAGDECSSESCLSDRPSPDSVPTGEELPHDDEATAEAIEKLRCQMEGML